MSSRLMFMLGVALCGLSAVLSLGVGRYPLAPAEIARLVMAALGGADHGLDPTLATVFWQLRLPRVLVALAVGAALAAAGSCLQRVFRNPLAAPELLGVSSGAALGAALAITAGVGVAGLQLSAFAGGMGAIALVFAVGPLLPASDRLLGLVLTGVAVSSLCGALLAALIALSDPRSELPAVTWWLLGSFSGVGAAELTALGPALGAACATMLALRWRADALALADDEAHAMGVRSGRLRLALIVAASLATAAAVAVAGIIGWVGLVVPHLARGLVGAAFNRSLPASLLIGATFMVWVDTVSRGLGEVELPPGVLAALVGAPLLFAMLVRRRRD